MRTVSKRLPVKARPPFYRRMHGHCKPPTAGYVLNRVEARHFDRPTSSIDADSANDRRFPQIQPRVAGFPGLVAAETFSGSADSQ